MTAPHVLLSIAATDQGRSGLSTYVRGLYRAALRHDLVGWRFFNRKDGIYRRVPRDEQLAALGPAYESVISVLTG